MKSNDWTHEGKVITQLTISNSYAQFKGFVYKITNLKTGEYYYGKKNLWKMAPKKKGEKKRRRVPSDWDKYYGSSEAMKAAVKELGIENFKREILEFCFTQGELSYKETELLFNKRVLFDDKCLNGNISGRWFKKEK